MLLDSATKFGPRSLIRALKKFFEQRLIRMSLPSYFFLNFDPSQNNLILVYLPEMRILGLILGLCLVLQNCQGSCPTIGTKEEYNEEGRRLCATVYEVSGNHVNLG
jgi:hypothetical protein